MKRANALVTRLRTLLGAEEGIALVIALVATAALAVVGTSVAAYSAQNYGSSSRSKADESTFTLAEAGLNNALAVLSNPANNPMDPGLLPATTATYENGTVTYSGTLDRTTAVWTLNSTASARNPTGSAVLRRTIGARVQVTPRYTAALGNGAWDYILATRTGTTCDETLSTGVTEGSPLYMKGTLCISTGAKITGGPLVVGKSVSLSGLDSIVGLSTNPIPAAHIGTWCKYYTNLQHTPCSSADNIFALTIDQNVPQITTPVPAWDTWYSGAVPGPTQPCTSSSGTVPVFDNDRVRNNSVASFSLTPSVSYSCVVGPPSAPIGEISWDASARVLTVSGTVYIDGSAKVDNGALNTYRGSGTLYLSGTFLLSANSKLCAKASGTDCDFSGWNPGDDPMLAVVANGSGGEVPIGDSVSLGSSSQFEGAIWSTNWLQFGSSAKVKAPLIATQVIFASGVVTYNYPFYNAGPVGLPGNQVQYAQVGAPQGFSG